MPTDLEFEANQLFHKLELAKLEVKFYEERLKEVQDKIKTTTKVPKKKTKKEKEIEQAYQDQALVEEVSNITDQIIKEKSKLWE